MGFTTLNPKLRVSAWPEHSDAPETPMASPARALGSKVRVWCFGFLRAFFNAMGLLLCAEVSTGLGFGV